jgi:hypothetical protein
MTGYLDRLAAKAAGAAPSARPRVPSLFEDAIVEDAKDTTRPDAAPALVPAQPLRASYNPPVRTAPISDPARSAVPSAAGRLHPPASGTEVMAAHSADPNPVSPADKPADPEPRPHLYAAPHPSPQNPERRDRVAAGPAAATPSIAVTARPRQDAAPLAGDTPREPDTVTVRIGRVDVRATLPSPVPINRPTAPRPADGPSLHDYLAGRRESR